MNRQVDASDVGTDAMLFQSNGNGVEHPVSFFFENLNSYQFYYSVPILRRRPLPLCGLCNILTLMSILVLLWQFIQVITR